MSEFKNVPLGQDVIDMDESPQFLPYSGVEISIGDEENTVIKYPESESIRNSGRVLRVENPWGSMEQAENMLSALQNGFRYQPYTAGGAILNPAAEIGDGVTVNVLYSGIYKMSKNFGSLMATDIAAPQDEEIDHEYPYEPQQDRVYQREINDTKAQINVTATQIRADVVSKVGGSTQSFGWNLQSDGWTLYSGNNTVLKATDQGLEVSGKITATSGFIGNGTNGFTISATSIWNGMDDINSTNSGVYIGTNGISVGGGNFRVTASGSVYISGTLNIGGSTITASQLQSGALSAFNNGSYWSGGAGGGYGFINATKQTGGTYPSFFKADTISAGSINVAGGNGIETSKLNVTGYSITVNGNSYSPKSKDVVTSISANASTCWVYISETGTQRYQKSYVNSVTASTTRIYYLGKD